MKKLHLDMVIGETTSEEENDKEHFSGGYFFMNFYTIKVYSFFVYF